MLKHRRRRRLLASSLIILGAVLMFFAPEVWAGVVMMVVGVVVEFIGIKLEHNAAD